MAQRLGELLGGLPALRQARELASLQQRFDAVVPARFRGEAMVAALEGGELRVLCANGAIASRLRLEADKLAQGLRQQGLAVQRVSLKVRPAQTARTVPKHNKAPLPAAARQAFESASEQMQDGAVKTALQELLKHHQSGSE